MPEGALKVIRPMVRIASAVAPGMVGRAAFTAFCTPPGSARAPVTGDRAKALEERLRQARIEHLSTSRGSVASYLFEPENASGRTVVLVHGWTGRAQFMLGFVKPLLAQGLTVVALDLPGHGASSGRQLNVPLGVEALKAAARRFGRFHGAIAHSFGGPVTLCAASGAIPAYPAIAIGRLVMIASPHSLADVTRDFGGMVGLGRRGQLAMERRVLEVAGRRVEEFEGPDLLRAYGKPTLLIHSRDDAEVSFASAEAMAAPGRPDVDLLALDGLGHRRILYAPSVIRAATAFVAG